MKPQGDPDRFFIRGGWMAGAALAVLCLLPASAFSQHEHHANPEMDHKQHKVTEQNEKAVEPGQEYRVPPPSGEMDHERMGNDMMEHDAAPGDLFRTRGHHENMEKIKPTGEDEKALAARGKAIFLHMCVFCHGEDGNGGGKAVEYLFPWPRDFRKGIFKFRSTPTDSLPRDEDLYRTIIRGVPGTSMPAWREALSPQDTWALIHLIKSFSPRFKEEKPPEPLPIPEPTPSTPEAIARGAKLFTDLKCVNCHGASLTGDGKLADSLMDAWKHAVFVHNITRPALFKGGYEPKEIFRTITTGLDGTPMESYVQVPEADRWALVHFIRSRFTEEPFQAEYETDLYSQPVDVELDTDIHSPIWEQARSTNIWLRPLSARRGAVEVINVASVHNGQQLAMRVKWKDSSKDVFTERRQDQFRDGAAVQFALGTVTLHTHGHNEPFFGMGNRSKPVNIWHWKAGLEEALEAEDDMEYSTGGVDMDALIFGGIMSNPVARLNTTADNPVEELNSEGFGTITPQPPENQNVTGYGEWKDGEWTVVFLRDMAKSGKWDVDFERKDPALVAFAVWDGEKEDRNGRKVITVWQRLNIVQPK